MGEGKLPFSVVVRGLWLKLTAGYQERRVSVRVQHIHTQTHTGVLGGERLTWVVAYKAYIPNNRGREVGEKGSYGKNK